VVVGISSRLNIGWSAERGEYDFYQLGGLSEEDLLLLHEQPSEAVRWRMLTAWFGHHGSRWGRMVYRRWVRNRARAIHEEHVIHESSPSNEGG
jgi:hypothetical protein